MFESLEHRVFLHTGPLQVTSVIADNRGEIQITLNQPIRPSNVNTGAIIMLNSGPDGILANGDDQRITTQLNYLQAANRIIIRGINVPPNSAYRLKLTSTRMETPDGDVHLDGEFNGTFPSGNGLSGGMGASGGNFEFMVKNDLSSTPLVRMSTSDGVLSLRMRRDAAPQTVANFLTYANAGDFDNIFYTRNIPGFISQLGSLGINASNQVVEGTVRPPVVNEFNISNTRGTIAMAKQGGNPNSATNQFFFNLADNSGNLDNQNGGFTVFAQAANTSSLGVMDSIANRPVVALRNDNTGDGVVPSFSATSVTDTPVKSTNDVSGEIQNVAPPGQPTQNRLVVTGDFSPQDDLIVVRRTGLLMRVLRLIVPK